MRVLMLRVAREVSFRFRAYWRLLIETVKLLARYKNNAHAQGHLPFL